MECQSIRRNGKDIVKEASGRDYTKMLAYAEKMELGTQDYELIKEDL